MNTFKFFWKEDCPKCPAAKNIVQQMKSKGYVTADYNMDTADGLAEAAFYGVLSTPTLLLLDEKEHLLAEWRGNIPTLEEVRWAAVEGKRISNESD